MRRRQLVEEFPHDAGGIRKKNSSFLYCGTRTMDEREGFRHDRPKGQATVVVVREVALNQRDRTGRTLQQRHRRVTGAKPPHPK